MRTCLTPSLILTMDDTYIHTHMDSIKEVIDLSDAFFLKICYKHRLQTDEKRERERKREIFSGCKWQLLLVMISVVSLLGLAAKQGQG